MIRTATAIAKIHQKNTVEIEHVDMALSLIKNMLSQQGISIDEADTYLSRQSNRAIQILHDLSGDPTYPNGMTVEDILIKMQNSGTKEEIQQMLVDLGEGTKLSDSSKIKTLFNKIKKSRFVKIISYKPLRLQYNNNPGSMDKWT